MDIEREIEIIVIYIFIAHSVEFYCVEFYSYDKQQVCVVLLCDHKQFQALQISLSLLCRSQRGHFIGFHGVSEAIL